MIDGSSLPIRVDRYGKRGPALVMLHGFAATNIIWRKWRPELEKRFQLHLVELKGHGQAPAPPDGRYGPRDQAECVLRYIRSIEEQQVVLVGHSMGGGVAMIVALMLVEQEPGRLAALVSLAGAAYPQPLPPFIHLARSRFVTRLLYWILPKRVLIRIILRGVVVDRSVIDQEQIDAYALPLMRRNTWRAIVQTALQILPPDFAELVTQLPRIAIPVLALWGRQDRVVPLAVGERIAAELPDARLVVLDDCGHIPTEEKPDESLEVLMGFFRDCGLTR